MTTTNQPQPTIERHAQRTDQGLIVTCANRQYRVRGVSMNNFERLRVNIRASQNEIFHIDSLDLYQSRARKIFAAQLAKLFKVDLFMIEADLLYLVTEVESYQTKLLNEEKQPRGNPQFL